MTRADLAAALARSVDRRGGRADRRRQPRHAAFLARGICCAGAAAQRLSRRAGRRDLHQHRPRDLCGAYATRPVGEFEEAGADHRHRHLHVRDLDAARARRRRDDQFGQMGALRAGQYRRRRRVRLARGLHRLGGRRARRSGRAMTIIPARALIDGEAEGHRRVVDAAELLGRPRRGERTRHRPLASRFRRRDRRPRARHAVGPRLELGELRARRSDPARHGARGDRPDDAGSIIVVGAIVAREALREDLPGPRLRACGFRAAGGWSVRSRNRARRCFDDFD